MAWYWWIYAAGMLLISGMAFSTVVEWARDNKAHPPVWGVVAYVLVCGALWPLFVTASLFYKRK